MRKFLRKIFQKPILWISGKIASSPDRKEIFTSLDNLYKSLQKQPGNIIDFDIAKGKFIIFSDHHRGKGDAADDFRNAKENYSKALEYYFENGYTLINLGDSEELWECSPSEAIEHNKNTLSLEAEFLKHNRYFKIYGNHDLEWKFLVPQNLYLKPIFGNNLKVTEGLLLRTTWRDTSYEIMFSHGHQGDSKSDGNAFSMWFVAAIWTPIQRYLEISIDVISDSFDLVDKHNILMYEWSATQKNLLFISGHTHKPVFASLDHIDRLEKEMEYFIKNDFVEKAAEIKEELLRRKKEYAGKNFIKTMAIPSYFNTGCCSFNDGDITGIEISEGYIKLVKWKADKKTSLPFRQLLENASLGYIFSQLKQKNPKA